MYRQNLTKAIRPAFRPVQKATRVSSATFSTTARTMAGGDTGAPRSTGVQHGDAFTKREKANEDYVIRMREKEKLAELKKKLAEQHESLKKLEDHIDEITRQQSEGFGGPAGEQK